MVWLFALLILALAVSVLTYRLLTAIGIALAMMLIAILAGSIWVTFLFVALFGLTVLGVVGMRTNQQSYLKNRGSIDKSLHKILDGILEIYDYWMPEKPAAAEPAKVTPDASNPSEKQPAQG